MTVCFLVLLAIPTGRAGAVEYSASILLGFNGGTGGQVGFQAGDFSYELPLAVRIAVSYLRTFPGDAQKAYPIFRGETTTTAMDEKADIWNCRLDVSYRFKNRSFSFMTVFGGARYSMFTGKFMPKNFQEDLEITSNQWGMGIGIQGTYEYGKNTDFLIQAGLDYYFPSTLKSNGTSYSPNGDSTNPQNGYTWDDANDAIDQPSWEPLLMIGVIFRFGG
jgi:hypothetical protein